MEKEIEALLEAIVAIVTDDATNWRIKQEKILKKLKDDSDRETAFEEFISWFEEE
jgi:hypothetical protein